MTDHLRTQIQALRDRWRANADMLAESNKGEWADPAVGMQRACADQLDTLLAGITQIDAARAEEVIDDAVSHWFIQGGKGQYGDIGDPKNPDELIAAILRTVRTAPCDCSCHEAQQALYGSMSPDRGQDKALLAGIDDHTPQPDRSSSPRAAGAQDEIQAVITEAEGLLKEITPGEWFVEHVVMSDSSDIYSRHPGGYTATIANVTGFRDDTFIAAAPRLVRQLVAALKASLPASPDPEDR